MFRTPVKNLLPPAALTFLSQVSLEIGACFCTSECSNPSHCSHVQDGAAEGFFFFFFFFPFLFLLPLCGAGELVWGAHTARVPGVEGG